MDSQLIEILQIRKLQQMEDHQHEARRSSQDAGEHWAGADQQATSDGDEIDEAHHEMAQVEARVRDMREELSQKLDPALVQELIKQLEQEIIQENEEPGPVDDEGENPDVEGAGNDFSGDEYCRDRDEDDLGLSSAPNHLHLLRRSRTGSLYHDLGDEERRYLGEQLAGEVLTEQQRNEQKEFYVSQYLKNRELKQDMEALGQQLDLNGNIIGPTFGPESAGIHHQHHDSGGELALAEQGKRPSGGGLRQRRSSSNSGYTSGTFKKSKKPSVEGGLSLLSRDQKQNVAKMIKSLKKTVYNPQDKNEAQKNVYFTQLLQSYSHGMTAVKPSSTKPPKTLKAHATTEKQLIQQQAEKYYNRMKKKPSGDGRKAKREASKKSKMSTMNSDLSKTQNSILMANHHLSKSYVKPAQVGEKEIQGENLQELPDQHKNTDSNPQHPNMYSETVQHYAHDLISSNNALLAQNYESQTDQSQAPQQQRSMSNINTIKSPTDHQMSNEAKAAQSRRYNESADRPHNNSAHSGSRTLNHQQQTSGTNYALNNSNSSQIKELKHELAQHKMASHTAGPTDYQNSFPFSHAAMQRRESRQNGFQYASMRNSQQKREASQNSDLQDLGLLGAPVAQIEEDFAPISQDNIFKNRQRKNAQNPNMGQVSVFNNENRSNAKKDGLGKLSGKSKQGINGTIQLINQSYSQSIGNKPRSSGSHNANSSVSNRQKKTFMFNPQNSKSGQQISGAQQAQQNTLLSSESNNINQVSNVAGGAQTGENNLDNDSYGERLPIKKKENIVDNGDYNQSSLQVQQQKSAKSYRNKQLLVSNEMAHELSTPMRRSMKVSKSTDICHSLYYAGQAEIQDIQHLSSSEQKKQQNQRQNSKPAAAKPKDLSSPGVQQPNDTMTDAATHQQQAEVRKNNKSEWSLKKAGGEEQRNDNHGHLNSNAKSSGLNQRIRNEHHLQNSSKRGEIHKSMSRIHGRDMSAEKQAELHYGKSNLQNTQPFLGMTQDEKDKIESQANFLARKQKALKQVAEYKEKIAAEKEKGNPIICQCVSVEPYIRRAINAIGWRENNNASSNTFHIKFDVSDIDIKVKPTQFYNHFPDNRHITTKVGLCKNLWYQTPNENLLQIQRFFPRCFDLSDQNQIEGFKEEFHQTAVISIINIIALLIANDAEVLKLKQLYERRKEFNNPTVFLKQFEDKCYYRDESLGVIRYFENIELIKRAHQCCQKVVDTIKNDFDHKLYQSSAVSGMLNNTAKFPQDKLEALLALHDQISSDTSFAVSLLDHISTSLKVKILSVHEQLQEICPQYKQIDGNQNIWVVKPSYNARGVGIYCTNKLVDIYQEGKKSQSKVVQKYIERPFLVHNRKFDVRQWVLVTSWEPLDAFVFQSAYLKFCSSEFSLEREALSDAYRHLSNYTIQKKNQNTNSDDFLNELIMSSEEFEAYNQKELGIDFSWNRDLLPRIQDVVYRTMKAVQETQLSAGTEVKTNCFEIYGFDLVLDEDLNPWVIEINLSPACKERTPWLTKMLDDSALDLVLWIERRILFNTQIEKENFTKSLREKKQKYNKLKNNNYFNKISTLNDEETQEENDIKYKWLRIPNCLEELEQHDIDQQIAQQLAQKNQYLVTTKKEPEKNKLNFEVIGKKADLKYEKKMETNFKKIQTALLAQRMWRGHKARRLATHIRRTNAAIIIQKYARMHSAIKLRKLLKLHKCTNLLQNYMRRILAKREAERLTAIKIHDAKCLVALKLQSHFRRKRDERVVQEVRLNTRATTIQKFMKGLRAHQEAMKLRYERTMIRRIQRFYRRRYRNHNRCAIQVQRHLKAYRTYHRYQRLKVIYQSSQKLQAMIQKRWKQTGFKKFVLNKNAIKIQCLVRRRIAWKKVEGIRTRNANIKLQMLCGSYFRMILRQQLRQLKELMNDKAKLVQKKLRTYMALNKLQKARERYQELQDSAIVIQKFMKGYQKQKECQNELEQRNKSAAKIQSLFKMFVTRKGYLQILEELHQLQVQQLDSQSVGSSADDDHDEHGDSVPGEMTPHRDTGRSHSMLNHDEVSQKVYENSASNTERPGKLRSGQRDELQQTTHSRKKSKSRQEQKSTEKYKRQSSRAGRSTKDKIVMNKSEKTVRALEDQFYGRSKEIDAQLAKGLKKVEATQRKLSQRRPPGITEVSSKFNPAKPNVYKSTYEIPKKKERRLPGGARAANEARNNAKDQLSFAENLKNLLANQSQQNKANVKQYVKKEQSKVEEQSKQPHHLYLRHYRPSGPLQRSDFLEDFKASQENFKKSQEVQKLKKNPSSSGTKNGEAPMTVVSSILNWGNTGKERGTSGKINNQRQKAQADVQHFQADYRGQVLRDESKQELKKIQKLQSNYGPSIFLLEQDRLKIEMDEKAEKRPSDLPDIHDKSNNKAKLQSAQYVVMAAHHKNFGRDDDKNEMGQQDNHYPLDGAQPDQVHHSDNIKNALLSNMTQRKNTQKPARIKTHTTTIAAKGSKGFDTHSNHLHQARNLLNNSQQKLTSTTTSQSIQHFTQDSNGPPHNHLKYNNSQDSSQQEATYTPQIVQNGARNKRLHGPATDKIHQTKAMDIFMPALDPVLGAQKHSSQHSTTPGDRSVAANVHGSALQNKRLKMSSSIGELPTLSKPPAHTIGGGAQQQEADRQTLNGGSAHQQGLHHPLTAQKRPAGNNGAGKGLGAVGLPPRILKN